MRASTFLKELTQRAVWANPFLPFPSPEPALRPWASPGRVSLAAELSDEDRRTWDEAVSYARPEWPRTLRGLLWSHLIEQQRELWSLPDDPLDSTEWIRQQRLRPYDTLAREILDDPALRLPRRR
ncbi:hypothetical protein [Nocardia sp. NPDC058633]|uniref:hypothetical protein n=1 Tax=Nocardia sp. NPDC058633 TaxID=3346568 RepID=UPI003663A555